MRRLIPLVLLLALTAGAAGAQEATEAPSERIAFDQAAHVRFALFSPDEGDYNIYLDGELISKDALVFPDVTGWMTVAAGAHNVAVTEAGGSLDAPVIPMADLTLNAMTWTTVALAGSQSDGSLQFTLVPEVTEDLLPGTARITFFNALHPATVIDFYRNEVPYSTSIGFGEFSTDQQDVHTYLYQAVTGGDEPRVIAELPDADINENRNYLVAAVGNPNVQGENAGQIVLAEANRAAFLVGMGQLEDPGTIVQAVAADADLTGDLLAAIEVANLTDQLSGAGPFTLFAPAEVRLDLNTQTPEAITAWVLSHVVEGEILSSDLNDGGAFTSLAGTPINVGVEGNGFAVNSVPILTVNIPATNGVVHLIAEPLAEMG